MRLAREEVWGWLERGDLRGLLVEELGWDYGGGGDREVEVGGHRYLLEAVAQKRGLVVYQCVAQSEDCFPDHPMRQKIEKAVAKIVREHLIVYISPDQKTQVWQWVKREPGRAERARTHSYHRGQRSELLLQKLARLHFSLEEEEKGLSIVEVAGRVRAAFDVEKVTKQFYERFKKEHRDFLGFIEGVSDAAGREWYASVMLNRLMFIYFIQKKSFLDGDVNYLRTNLAESKKKAGADRFYHGFLSSLFFEGFAQPPSERSEQTKQQLGEVPYLNGGIFQRHPLEQQPGENIQIPDRAFERLFGFFEQYQWHLEDRPLRKDNEINPDVLGYIFEKYINQKQMGAYYTKEDITGYLGRNTILPFLWGQAQKSCAIAFEPGGGVWRLLAEEPDRYLYPAVRHGITYDLHENIELANKRELPSKIAVGIKNVGNREDWNQPAPAKYGLPTETWREHVGRRQRYEEVRAKLAAGEVQSISDLVTYNLDLEKLAQDVIYNSEGPELVRAFWKALREVSVLDPTCGSGAFLFAALNLLEPLYTACLDAMRGFVDDLERAQSTPPPPPRKVGRFSGSVAAAGSACQRALFCVKVHYHRELVWSGLDGRGGGNLQVALVFEVGGASGKEGRYRALAGHRLQCALGEYAGGLCFVGSSEGSVGKRSNQATKLAANRGAGAASGCSVWEVSAAASGRRNERQKLSGSKEGFASAAGGVAPRVRRVFGGRLRRPNRQQRSV